MGSFNTSCFASHQTIAPGDKCYVLPLVQRVSFEAIPVHYKGELTQEFGITDSIVYPNGFWQLLGGFIEAKYDDYGRVEVSRTPRNFALLAHFFSALRRTAGKVEQGRNPYHDVPYDLETFLASNAPLFLKSLDPQGTQELPADVGSQVFDELLKVWVYTWEAAQEHRLFVSRRDKVLRPAQFAILHSESYDYLASLTAKQSTWDDVSLEPRSYFDWMLGRVAEELADIEKTMRDSLGDQYEELQKAQPNQLAAVVSGAMYPVQSTFFEELKGLAHFERDLSLLERDCLRAPVGAYLKKELSADELFEQVKPFVEDRAVLSALEALNLYITPLVYAGQDYTNELGGAYAKFVRSVSASVTKARKARYK